MQDNFIHVKRTVDIPISDTVVTIDININKHDTLESVFDAGLYHGIRAAIECLGITLLNCDPIISDK